MTPEQKLERKRAREEMRKERREQDEREAPQAFICRYKTERGVNDDFFNVILSSGDTHGLTLRYQGEWFGKPDEWGGREVRLPYFFSDLKDLARLIHALTTRYNTMAREINQTVRETPPLETLETFPAQEEAAS